jgi:hypothetical protein
MEMSWDHLEAVYLIAKVVIEVQRSSDAGFTVHANVFDLHRHSISPDYVLLWDI